MGILTLDNFDVKDKTVLLRVDMNCPIHPDTCEILGTKRIEEVVETKSDQLDPEAIRRAAHLAAEKEAEAKRVEAEERAAKAHRSVGVCPISYGASHAHEERNGALL